ncbi:MAG: hypothetical protein VX667_05460 [Nitrospinota bacterium]|nr:hypothetical protein [Nitrospinota bacterium]
MAPFQKETGFLEYTNLLPAPAGGGFGVQNVESVQLKGRLLLDEYWLQVVAG